MFVTLNVIGAIYSGYSALPATLSH